MSVSFSLHFVILHTFNRCYDWKRVEKSCPNACIFHCGHKETQRTSVPCSLLHHLCTTQNECQLLLLDRDLWYWSAWSEQAILVPDISVALCDKLSMTHTQPVAVETAGKTKKQGELAGEEKKKTLSPLIFFFFLPHLQIRQDRSGPDAKMQWLGTGPRGLLLSQGFVRYEICVLTLGPM